MPIDRLAISGHESILSTSFQAHFPERHLQLMTQAQSVVSEFSQSEVLSHLS